MRIFINHWVSRSCEQYLKDIGIAFRGLTHALHPDGQHLIVEGRDTLLADVISCK